MYAFSCHCGARLLSPAKAAVIVLKETGSTLLYPLFQMWIRDYPAVAPGVTLTAAATGSGTGEKEAMAGQAQIGASDAYLSEEDAEQNPEIKNIPVAISAQVPGLSVVTGIWPVKIRSMTRRMRG